MCKYFLTIVMILGMTLAGCNAKQKPECICKDLPESTTESRRNKTFCYISDAFNDKTCDKE